MRELIGSTINALQMEESQTYQLEFQRGLSDLYNSTSFSEGFTMVVAGKCSICIALLAFPAELLWDEAFLMRPKGVAKPQPGHR